jgi:septal ring factor EnvC (AmiA/AmiB activator)
MDEKEIKEYSERYAQLLTDYAGLLSALDKVLKRVDATRKEILYLEKTMEAVGVEIKDINKDGNNISG